VLPEQMKLMILSPSFASDLKEKNGSNFLTIKGKHRQVPLGSLNFGTVGVSTVTAVTLIAGGTGTAFGARGRLHLSGPVLLTIAQHDKRFRAVDDRRVAEGNILLIDHARFPVTDE